MAFQHILTSHQQLSKTKSSPTLRFFNNQLHSDVHHNMEEKTVSSWLQLKYFIFNMYICFVLEDFFVKLTYIANIIFNLPTANFS